MGNNKLSSTQSNVPPYKFTDHLTYRISRGLLPRSRGGLARHKTPYTIAECVNRTDTNSRVFSPTGFLPRSRAGVFKKAVHLRNLCLATLQVSAETRLGKHRRQPPSSRLPHGTPQDVVGGMPDLTRRTWKEQSRSKCLGLRFTCTRDNLA